MAGTIARIRRRVRIGMATVISGAVLLGGCSDGLEINSPQLNSLGVATGALGKTEEPKLAPRAPLVIPPSTQRLPEPGQPRQATAGPAADAAWPKDRDQQRVATAAEKKRRHSEYCRDGNWKERAMDHGAGGAQGPEGSCNTLLDWAGGLFSGSSSEPESGP